MLVQEKNPLDINAWHLKKISSFVDEIDQMERHYQLDNWQSLHTKEAYWYQKWIIAHPEKTH